MSSSTVWNQQKSQLQKSFKCKPSITAENIQVFSTQNLRVPVIKTNQALETFEKPVWKWLPLLQNKNGDINQLKNFVLHIGIRSQFPWYLQLWVLLSLGFVQALRFLRDVLVIVFLGFAGVCVWFFVCFAGVLFVPPPPRFFLYNYLTKRSKPVTIT